MDNGIYVFGEGMLELAASGERVKFGYGGDAFNTAVYLARLGVKVEFASALGDDPFSNKARTDWGALGLSLSHCLTAPRKVMGLYAIHVDTRGERSFTYWRGQSAARTFFALDGANVAEAAMGAASLFYFSLISLSILDEAQRARLACIARAVRQRGGMVAFDTNYRRQGWSDASEARAVVQSIMPHITIALPSVEDHQGLFGHTTFEQCAEAWKEQGAQEVVVKNGENGCLLMTERQVRRMPGQAVRAVDTTGAGDSFNAGYLAARLAGRGCEDACVSGQMLAAKVVQHHGAIAPLDAMTVW